MAQREVGIPAPGVLAPRRRLPWYVALWPRLMRQKPLGAFGGAIILGMLLAAALADFVAPYSYRETRLLERLQSYSLSHPLGTDELGRDMLSRLIFGARVSLYVGFGAVSLSTFLAILMGVLSGYFGGRGDMLLQRFVDAWMSFPWIVILLSFMAIFGPGLMNVILVLGVLGSFASSRVIRSAVMAVKGNTYVEAAAAVGCGRLRIITAHILPNIMAPIIVIATVSLGGMILAEATLSFLGFGVPPPHPSWGAMLSGSGREYMFRAPWMSIWPGVALTLAVFGFNMLGDALRDLLDPRQSNA